MSESVRFSDQELLDSVVPSLREWVDRGNGGMAWAMGATSAGQPMLMGAALRAIGHGRAIGGEDVSDEELAGAVAREMRNVRLLALEHTSLVRHHAEGRSMVKVMLEREAAERAADPTKQAEYDAEQERWRLEVADVKRRVAAGEVVGDGIEEIEARLRGLSADGVGRRLAEEELVRDRTDTARRMVLVRRWLSERLSAESCPPWAADEFDQAEALLATIHADANRTHKPGCPCPMCSHPAAEELAEGGGPVNMGGPITLEQVRSELLAIIDANPDRTGSLVTQSGVTSSCVYFEPDSAGAPDTDAPCCIVGHWLALRPDLMERLHDLIEFNESWEDSGENQSIEMLDDDASALLGVVQGAQDGPPARPWRELRPLVETWEPTSG